MLEAVDNNYTLLVLDGMGVPLYSARGLSQTLDHEDMAEDQEYSVNGVLLDLSYSQFRKYRSVISCKDQRVPRLDGIWPGQQVIVHCIITLCYPIGGSPSRPVVPGSAFIEGGFVHYRPALTMMLGKSTQSAEEYAADVQWAIPFREV